MEIVKVRKIFFSETTDYCKGIVRNAKEKLFVAEISDGTSYYTSVGGTDIYGTFEKLEGGVNISDLHDFTNKHFDGINVNDEETFRKCVNEMLKSLED